MSLGDRLYELRKEKNISQEEVAEILNVTRQTISKWETNQSQPDFDKILPICNLYGITTDELLTGSKNKSKENNNENSKKKTALVVSTSIFLYFLSVIWIIIMEPMNFINENILVGVFLFICAVATIILIFHFISNSNSIRKEEKINKVKYKNDNKIIDDIITLLFSIIYFLVSFLTMKWRITWIIWIVYALVLEIAHLIIKLKDDKNE